MNDDLKPVEPARRQWGPWNFVGFWIADSFNINTWMISSSMIVGGLSWWQSWLCVWIGYAISGLFIASTGRIGATYHIGFPVVSRSSFGIWGSLWPVFNRAAMGMSYPRLNDLGRTRPLTATACIWYGVQAYIGGHCVYLMIRSIWKSWVWTLLHVVSSFLLSDHHHRTGRRSTIPFPRTLEQLQRITFRFSSSGSAHFQLSGSLYTRFATSSP